MRYVNLDNSITTLTDYYMRVSRMIKQEHYYLVTFVIPLIVSSCFARFLHA